MCGFVAISEPGRVFDDLLLADLAADLKHRGPDSGGLMSETGAALAFRRLAILDPATVADQPMTDPTGRYTIVFNGEIYNYRRLREDLEAVGARFRTKGDTEVILAAYTVWGENCFARLEGMFAVIIIDRETNQLIAARDAFGIKPLYLTRRGKLAAFASEMRPLARLIPISVDQVSLAELLVFRFAAGRLSNLAGIESLPGGTIMVRSLATGDEHTRRFADPLATIDPDPSIDMESAIAQSRDVIIRSVRDHLASDVGYAVQLSGGVDSSLVSAIAQRETGGTLASYGVRIPDFDQDEAPYRTQAVKRIGLDHTEITLDEHAFADALPRAVRHMEGPVPHYGCVMLMLLCDRIRTRSKVVLTGEGADEMFGGYKRYDIWRDLARKGRLAKLVPEWMWPFLQRWREIQRYSGHDPAIFAAVYHDFLALNALFPELIPVPGAREAAAARFADFRERMFAVDQAAYLPSLLMRQDKMAMAASVEARVPFTHMPLAKVVNRFPAALRAPGGATKPILKSVAEEFLPHDLIHRRKVGLTLPLDKWLSNPDGLGRYVDLLAQPDSQLAAFTSPGALRNVVERFRAGKLQGMPPMAHLVNLELWLRSLPTAAT
ncbi:MAG: asparagine synthase (glutamine-hydrolyzing) [Rhodospirillaceae bacterium]|nr:asparagine synthase (glutamine-hydrolyzing) [Rhodospirillaceae bacterium]